MINNIMPLKKGQSKKTISSNIGELVKTYNKKGKIGTSKPKTKNKAVKQAAAIAYDKAEEDEQSISKQMKTKGKITIKGPDVKQRKAFAPATKVESPKKGKGSYNRSKITESKDIVKFIECLMVNDFATADKYIHRAMEAKLQDKIQKELNTPLFDK